MVATRNRGRRGSQPREGNRKAARCRFYPLQSAPLPASVQSELTQRALERGLGSVDHQRFWEALGGKLTRFLHVPGMPLDNNMCEQALKMAT